jgi:hypothetical protein
MDDSTKSLHLAVTLHPDDVVQSIRVENNAPSIQQKTTKEMVSTYVMLCHQFTSRVMPRFFSFEKSEYLVFKPSEST